MSTFDALRTAFARNDFEFVILKYTDHWLRSNTQFRTTAIPQYFCCEKKHRKGMEYTNSTAIPEFQSIG